jgi:hypothetical protein
MTDTMESATTDHYDQLLLLRDDRIIETVDKLQQRIEDRFPGSGLAQLCGHLLDVSRQAGDRTAWIARPILWIRVTGYFLAFSLLVIVLALIYEGVIAFGLKTSNLGLTDFIQTFDAGASGCIFVSAAIYFLISLETRIKRSRALSAVNELRSIAHIIDMHQLTKDPERVLRHWQGTKNSPQQSMSPLLLSRYLDYCTEMLSLTGKIAALYVERFDDKVAVAAVRDIEQLTTGLSRKIWQKIIVTRIIDDREGRSPDDPIRRVFVGDTVSAGEGASETDHTRPAPNQAETQPTDACEQR